MQSSESAGEGVRKTRRRSTHLRLREVGRAAFEAHGFHATTVAQIAEAAGVAHGTFYVHFRSKDELMDQLLAEENEALRRLLEPTIDRVLEVPLEVTMRACAEVYLDHTRQTARFINAYLERAVRGLGAAEIRDGVNEPMAALLTEALSHMLQAAGQGAARVDCRLAARALLAMWLRVGLQYALGHETSRADAAEILTRLSAGAIGSLTAAATRR